MVSKKFKWPNDNPAEFTQRTPAKSTAWYSAAASGQIVVFL